MENIKKINKEIDKLTKSGNIQQAIEYCQKLLLSEPSDTNLHIRLGDLYMDWHLDIYGEGELRQELEAAAKIKDMNIHIHQPTEHIFDAYRDSSILVSTSLYEPFGLVIPEAMSCGLPVVAYDCPYGPGEIVTHTVDGFLVKKFCKLDFVEKCSKLIEEQEIRINMGRSGIESSMRFKSDKIIPQWIELFEKITN